MSTTLPWTSHRTLMRQAIIQADVENTSPLRIGSGREAPLGSQVDLAVLRIHRNGRDEPYIPGSSLKGVFRSVGEAMARAEKKIEVCSGLTRSTCMDTKQVDGARLGELVERRLRLNEAEAAVELFHQHACLMCKVFGAPSYGAHVYFGDAYVIEEYTLNTRTGIAIDRRTGAAFQGALYTVEYVEPGTTFRLDIKTTNLPNYVLGMFAKILKMIDRGEVRVGGFKTRGFGELRLKTLNIRIKDLHRRGSRVLEKLDERDIETDLNGLVEIRDGFLYAEGEGARQVLDKLEEVWNRASL
jgi:CRISPR-associated protein Csm3